MTARRITLILALALMPAQALALSKSDLHAVQSQTTNFIANDQDAAQCGTGSSTGPLVGKDNIEKIYNFLTGQTYKGAKITPMQAAAIIGNLEQESGQGTNPLAVNPRSGAYGIGQWLGGRLTGLKARPNYDTLQTQIEYLWWEVSDPASREYQGFHALDNLLAATSLPDAVERWELKFERAGLAEANIPARIRYAQAVLDQFGAGGGAGGGASPGCGATTGGCTNPMTDAIWKSALNRTDDGVDYGYAHRLPPGTAINAPCDMTILDTTTSSGWPGGVFIYAKITSGPFTGKCWYVAEDVKDLPAKDAKIAAGQKIAAATGGPDGIEIGFAKSMRLSAMSVGDGNYPAPSGRAVAKFLRSLGAPTRDDPGADAPDYAGGSCP